MEEIQAIPFDLPYQFPDFDASDMAGSTFEDETFLDDPFGLFVSAPKSKLSPPARQVSKAATTVSIDTPTDVTRFLNPQLINASIMDYILSDTPDHFLTALVDDLPAVPIPEAELEPITYNPNSPMTDELSEEALSILGLDELMFQPAPSSCPTFKSSWSTAPPNCTDPYSAIDNTLVRQRSNSCNDTPRSAYRGKLCVVTGCSRRAQSNSKCKAHGGGSRCQFIDASGDPCHRSSQGGGFCRSHGGGKRCEIPGCERGQQRKGLCYMHGGIRRCQFMDCLKKDRGKGFCISHGGGKRCQYHNGCTRSVRRGNFCQAHS